MSSAEFPVQWEDPADAQLYWKRDTVHEPRPALPLRRSFSRQIIGAGIDRVLEVLPFPGTSRSIVVNGYTFETDIADPPDVSERKMKIVTDRLPQHIADLPRRWAEEFQPELERDLAAWRAFDLQGATYEQLVQHIAHVLERAVRHWEIHFLTVFPILESTRPLAKLYAQLTGDSDEQTPYRLLAGFPTKTSERDLALWQLSEYARQAPSVQQAFTTHEPKALLATLRALDDPAAQTFVRACDAYLQTYGDRSEGTFDAPTWREDPTFVLLVLKGYLSGAHRHPQAELQAVADERERLIADTLAKIPDAEREGFMRVLKAAQAVYPLRETHAFYIDQASVSQLHYMLVELGKRLAAMGALAQPHDIFYLELDELRALMPQPARARVQDLIAHRRADYARWSKLIAPAAIGTPPPSAAPSDDEMAKFFRPIETDMPSGAISALKGAAGSRGVARGPARVVMQQDEFARVQSGDVLVCPTTFPPWTPLFRMIAALVTDAGGVLSHGAIVAREYKLPAVVGTGYATRALHDGQLVEVDGTKGIVTIL